MVKLRRRYRVGLILAIFCLPALAHAQDAARSFDQLRGMLKPDDIILVIENSGAETIGRVAEITSDSVAVTTLVREDGPSTGTTKWSTGERRRFSVGDIALIHRPDLSTDARVLLYAASGPFQPLQGRLKIGQTAIVVNTKGQTISGKVIELRASSLVVTAGSVKRSFDAAEVAIIRRPGPIWDGAVKGALIGMLTMWLALSNCYNCENGSFVALGGGIGGAIGLGFDAAFGPKTLYYPRR